MLNLIFAIDGFVNFPRSFPFSTHVLFPLWKVRFFLGLFRPNLIKFSQTIGNHRRRAPQSRNPFTLSFNKYFLRQRGNALQSIMFLEFCGKQIWVWDQISIYETFMELMLSVIDTSGRNEWIQGDISALKYQCCAAASLPLVSHQCPTRLLIDLRSQPSGTLVSDLLWQPS